MNPQVYVGTHEKYAAGRLSGAWIELEDFASKADFLEHCDELHSDEYDPEFMFQDYMEVPADLISESYISDLVWEFLDYSPDEREIIAAYCDNVVCDWSVEAIGEAMDAYCGEFDSREDFACQYVHDSGLISDPDSVLATYFDYSAFARDIFLSGDYVWVGGMVFWGHV